MTVMRTRTASAVNLLALFSRHQQIASALVGMSAPGWNGRSPVAVTGAHTSNESPTFMPLS